MLALLLSVLPRLVCGATGLTYDVGLRTEARAEAAAAGASGLALSPHLALTLRDDPNQLQLGYEPELGLGLGIGQTAVLHRGHLQGGWSPFSGTRLTGEARLGYGIADLTLAQPSTTGEATLQPRPEVGPVHYLQAEVSAGVEQRLSNRLVLSGHGAYLASGGADDAARTSVPLTTGPRGEAALTYSLSRLDALAARASASRESFDPGGRVDQGQLVLDWRRRLDRETELGLAAGAAWVSVIDAHGEAQPAQGLPVLEVRAERHLLLRGEGLQARLWGRVAPFVDPLTGAAYPRTELRAGLGWLPQPRLGLAASAGVASPLPGALAGASEPTVAEGELGATWAASSQLHLLCGVRGSLQGLTLPAAAGYAAVAYTGETGL